MKHINKHKKTKNPQNCIKLHNLIMFIICTFSLCSLDSEHFYIPLAAVVVSGGWLVFVAWLNGYMK